MGRGRKDQTRFLAFLRTNSRLSEASCRAALPFPAGLKAVTDGQFLSP